MQTKNGLVFPDWRRNIINIPASLAKYCGRPTGKPTSPTLDRALKKDYRNVCVLVIDGLGAQILTDYLPPKSFLRRHHAENLTSVFPSTTASATTTLISGLYPAEHGWFAWSVDVAGQVVELFRNRDAYTGEPTADPDFAHHHFPYPYFYENLDPAWTTRLVYPPVVNDRPRAGEFHQYATLKELRQTVTRLAALPGHNLIYAYHCDLDSVLHEFGPGSKESRKLLADLDATTKKMVQDTPDTLFIITADHGQIPLAAGTPLNDDPAITACLTRPISLDPRAACFFVDPAKKTQFLTAFAKYRQDFTLFATDDLIKNGVFGPEPPRPEYRQCLGDFIAVGNDRHKMIIFTPRKALCNGHPYRGHHTGLTAAEMYVPLILAAKGE